MLTLLHSFNDLALFRPARLVGMGSETFQECSDDDNYVPLERRESFDNAEDSEEAEERLVDSKIEEAKKKVKTEWIDPRAESRNPHHKKVARVLTEALKSKEEEYERILREELEAYDYDVEKLAEILFNNLFNTEIKGVPTVQAPEPIGQPTPEKREEEGEEGEAFKAFRAEREAPRTVRNAMELFQDIIDFMLLGPEQDKKEMGRLLKAAMGKRAEEYEAMLRRELEEHGYDAEELADLLMEKLLEEIPPGSLPPAFKE